MVGKALALQLMPAPGGGEKLPVFRHLDCDLGRASWTAVADLVEAGSGEAHVPCLL